MNLGFFRGAELDDPEGLLVGDGKAIRHLRISAKGERRRKGVRDLLVLAVEWGIVMAARRDGVQPRVVGGDAGRPAKKAAKQKPAKKKPAKKTGKKARKTS